MTQDNHKGFVIAYNYLNLPVTFTKGTNIITITYAADGTKLSKAVTGGGATKNYVSGIEYSGANVEAIYHSEGRCTPNGSAFYYDYTIKDHLGNARVNFRANGTAVVHLEEMHYYPFGMLMEGLGSVSPANDYTYNGKELNDDFGLNLSGYAVRWYDASVGRWWGVDPLAHERSWLSPYSFVQNNPINRVDLNGALDEWVEQNGQMMFDNRVTNQADATALYGEGATYRPNGYTYTSSDGSNIELGDYGFFKQNGQIKSSPDLAENSLANTNPSLAMSNAQNQIAGVRGDIRLQQVLQGLYLRTLLFLSLRMRLYLNGQFMQ